MSATWGTCRQVAGLACSLQLCNTFHCMVLPWKPGMWSCVSPPIVCLLCRVRAAYKAIQNPKDLEKELPQCALGSMLLSWIKQVDRTCHCLAACVCGAVGCSKSIMNNMAGDGGCLQLKGWSVPRFV